MSSHNLLNKSGSCSNVRRQTLINLTLYRFLLNHAMQRSLYQAAPHSAPTPLTLISYHLIPYSLVCGASCDSSHVLASKHMWMWCATKSGWWVEGFAPHKTHPAYRTGSISCHWYTLTIARICDRVFWDYTESTKCVRQHYSIVTCPHVSSSTSHACKVYLMPSEVLITKLAPTDSMLLIFFLTASSSSSCLCTDHQTGPERTACSWSSSLTASASSSSCLSSNHAHRTQLGWACCLLNVVTDPKSLIQTYANLIRPNLTSPTVILTLPPLNYAHKCWVTAGPDSQLFTASVFCCKRKWVFWCRTLFAFSCWHVHLCISTATHQQNNIKRALLRDCIIFQ